jgi:four helix bundle protein
MQSFRSMRVWQRGHALVVQIYVLTRSFPPEERFGLAQQMRRAAASVPTNLAEGSRSVTTKEFAHFVHVAHRSVAELDYQLELARDVGLLSPAATAPLATECDEIGRMLHALRMSASRR